MAGTLPEVSTIPSKSGRGEGWFQDPPSVVAAIVLLNIACGTPTAIMPGVLAAFIDSRGIGPAQTSGLVIAEMTAMTLAMLLAASFVATIDRRRLALGAVLAAVTGHLLSSVATPYYALVACRALAGLGEGTLTAVVAASVARTRAPDRIFGLGLSINLVVSLTFYAILPTLQKLGGVIAILGALATLCVVAGSGTLWLPAHADVASSRGTRSPEVLQKAVRGLDWLPGLLGLGAILALFAGIGATWPAMTQIALSHGLDRAHSTADLATASFIGILSGLFVSWLGARVGRMIPLILGCTGLIVAMLFLLGGGATAFGFAAISFMFWWVFTVPYYIGSMSVMDRSGRLSAFALAMTTTGIACGQALSAAVVKSGVYMPAIASSMALVLLAMVLIIVAIRLSVGIKKTAGI